jgi:hypothetical protein
MKKLIIVLISLMILFSSCSSQINSNEKKQPIDINDKDNVLPDSILTHLDLTILDVPQKHLKGSMSIDYSEIAPNQLIYSFNVYPADTSIQEPLFSMTFEMKKPLIADKTNRIFFNKTSSRSSRCNFDNLLQTNYGTIRPWDSDWDGFLTLKYHVVTDKQIFKTIDGDFSFLIENFSTHEKIYIIDAKFKNAIIY